MNTKFKTWLLPSVLFFTVLGVSRAADDEPAENPALKKLYSEFQTLFRKHYPKATSHLLKNKIHFEHDTRIFMVHDPGKVGDWSEAREKRGPKRGGILCDIELRKGPYGGAAEVPQTFDKLYFKLLLLAPYSKKLDANLYVHLYYPSGATDEFVKQFTELVNAFEKHMDKAE